MTTTRGLRDRSEPITMLTAYDAGTARLIDDAGIDVLLVGDSMGTEALGYDSTLPVTVEDVERRTAAVARGSEEALVVADMPFLSVGVDESETVRNAGRMLKEAGANAVKLESGPHTVDLTDHLTHLGIPVMAHLGLTPQHVNQLGGYTRQGTTEAAAEGILSLARAHEGAGAFALVLEHVPANVAAQVTEALDIPTIGIGAGGDCDGQVLVINDVLGLSEDAPPFAEQFGDVRAAMTDAIEKYRDAVESESFPAEKHSHVEDGLDDLS
ncbi:MAG: 3-methyl-2-oxobutanoate hydroxymethyltransferase [Halonotius sp. J07HN6]|jgi:ketopantoate hydroxymethyltransferase (EC 2.1.2.11)|nr:MAG: 3-methyl-2-oxobutanoate hydroxymethyltransferase [Halonotius sp. J07HN6]ERH05599.1 MAG: 3-methyl-2-oxobutanoate hydroxymethyltransferase [Halonotius sp. J07HN4]